MNGHAHPRLPILPLPITILPCRPPGEPSHTASGTIGFGIGSLGSHTFASTSGTGESGLLRRWAGLVAMAGVIGPLALTLVVLRRRRGALPPINSAITLARRRLLSLVVAAA